MLGRPVRCEEGQGVVEYGLILALIVIVAIVALSFFGLQISSIVHAVAK
jgi:Flp pilus assembly pilin Flp